MTPSIVFLQQTGGNNMIGKVEALHDRSNWPANLSITQVDHEIDCRPTKKQKFFPLSLSLSLSLSSVIESYKFRNSSFHTCAIGSLKWKTWGSYINTKKEKRWSWTPPFAISAYPWSLKIVHLNPWVMLHHFHHLWKRDLYNFVSCVGISLYFGQISLCPCGLSHVRITLLTFKNHTFYDL